jgi:ABC-2 type transport system permease protein
VSAAPGTPSAALAIGLVAKREIRERSRTKGFRISAAILLAAAVLIAVLPSLINPDTTRRIGVVGEPPAGFQQTLEQAAAVEANPPAIEVSSFADVAAGEPALRDGSIEVLLDPTTHSLVWVQDADPEVEALLNQADARQQVVQRIDQAGLDPTQVAQILAPSTLGERSLETVDPERATKIAVALAGTILLFISLQVFGGMVLSGVVEEKTSRIAEVLLAHVRPDHLLAGKVLGIGTLALAELVAIVTAAMVAGQLAGTIPLPTVGITAAASMIVWFVLGFAFYAVLFASAGALVNRQEDAQSVTIPVMLPLIAAYVFVLSTISIPDNPVTAVLSFIPLTSPVAMPVRTQLGAAPLWQAGLSVLIMIAAGAVLLNIAGRVYAGGLLRTGKRVKVREALASAGDVGA